MKKVLCVSLLLFVFCLLFSPFLSLAFPGKYRDHVYFRIAYNVIVYNTSLNPDHWLRYKNGV